MKSAVKEWQPSPREVILSYKEVHLWKIPLDVPAARATDLEALLTTDELRRADRYYFPRDRKHFVVGRGLQRTILAQYLESTPEEIRFGYGPHGKPLLENHRRNHPVQFNLAQSEALALLAVSRGRRVGVDLERIRPHFDYDGLVEEFFSTGEVARFQRLPADKKAEAFFNCWTRKEAYLKARGDGLLAPLNQFDVSLIPGEKARLIKTNGDAGEVQRWSLRSLRPAAGFIAALAVEGHDWRLKRLQFVE